MMGVFADAVSVWVPISTLIGTGLTVGATYLLTRRKNQIAIIATESEQQSRIANDALKLAESKGDEIQRLSERVTYLEQQLSTRDTTITNLTNTVNTLTQQVRLSEQIATEMRDTQNIQRKAYYNLYEQHVSLFETAQKQQARIRALEKRLNIRADAVDALAPLPPFPPLMPPQLMPPVQTNTLADDPKPPPPATAAASPRTRRTQTTRTKPTKGKRP
jgi:hypothetical protein